MPFAAETAIYVGPEPHLAAVAYWQVFAGFLIALMEFFDQRAREMASAYQQGFDLKYELLAPLSISDQRYEGRILPGEPCLTQSILLGSATC